MIPIERTSSLDLHMRRSILHGHQNCAIVDCFAVVSNCHFLPQCPRVFQKAKKDRKINPQILLMPPDSNHVPLDPVWATGSSTDRDTGASGDRRFNQLHHYGIP